MELWGLKRTDCGVEDVHSIGSVIVEGLVYDVPCVALSLIMRDLVRDVVLQGGDECCVCPGSRSDW